MSSEQLSEVERLRRTLAEVLLPLEVLHATGDGWKHSKLRRRYEELISPSLREQIERSVELGREELFR